MTKHPLLSLLFSRSLWRSALRGAVVAFTLLFTWLLWIDLLDEGVWVLLPMLTVSVGGACGGAFIYLVGAVTSWQGWKKMVVTILSVLAYCVVVWVSLVGALAVLGLWD